MSVVRNAIADFPFEGRNLLVSCSGGLDSMVLLHALVAEGYKPVVLHVNYHLRGEDSNADQEIVENTANDLGLSCMVHHCPAKLTKGEGINLQSAARNFRRELYAGWIALSPDNAVVLAHHANDQIETFFLQYFRGSGSLGLGGMFSDKNGITRPFLDISRQDIHAYAVSEKVSWREDKSNQSTAYIRNLFRNKLLPALAEENKSLSESVLLFMKVLRRQRELNEEFLSPIILQWHSGKKLSVHKWNELEEDQQLVLLACINLPLWVKDRLPELIYGNGSQKLELNDGILVKEENEIIFIKNDRKTGWQFKIEEVEILPEVFSKQEIYLDKDKFDEKDLLIRNPRRGDRIKSLGMDGSQLVSDILKENKIPEWKRSAVSLVEIKGEIIWIPGIKIGRMYLADKKSVNILKLTCL